MIKVITITVETENGETVVEFITPEKIEELLKEPFFKDLVKTIKE